MRWKPVKCTSKTQILELETETGHIVKFKLEPKLSVDIDSDDNGNPFFYMNLIPQYEGVESTPTSMSLEQIQRDLNHRNILTPELEYDHIQIGFVYAPGDPQNHRWMLNFMDVNNKHLFGFFADVVELNCAFTTMSWEDGIWHGRFVVQKKDVTSLDEAFSGHFILTGNRDIGQHTMQPLDSNVDRFSLRFNVHENVWYCDQLKGDDVLGSIPCKNIICDVPFVGKVDKSYDKPKVTAEIAARDVQGISMALNALIIKSK
jgi:hypothetical protein